MTFNAVAKIKFSPKFPNDNVSVPRDNEMGLSNQPFSDWDFGSIMTVPIHFPYIDFSQKSLFKRIPVTHVYTWTQCLKKNLKKITRVAFWKLIVSQTNQPTVG